MASSPRTLPALLAFWLPLAGTWLLMAVEGPFLAAIIARLAEPKPNLAAYGVAFAFAILVESPVILLMSATTALVKGRYSLAQMTRFTRRLNLGVSLGMLLLALPPVWEQVSALLGLDDQVARLVQGSLLILLPWPASIGDRRFHQGLLIAAGQTRRVAGGTLLRLVAMASTALLLAWWGGWPGAWVGAAALSAGVVTEMIAVRRMVRGARSRLQATDLADEVGDPRLNLREIGRFYTPMAMTSLLGLAVQPTVTFFVGRGRMPLESLAIFPVLHSLSFVFRAIALSYHEVVVSQLRPGGTGWKLLRNVAWGMALLIAACMAALAYTPLQGVWFEKISGLSPELAAFGRLPLQILWPLPVLSVLLSVQRGLLVARRETGPMGPATAAELIVVAGVLALGILVFDWVGAVAAMAALLAGRIAGVTWLAAPSLRAAKAAARDDQSESTP